MLPLLLAQAQPGPDTESRASPSRHRYNQMLTERMTAEELLRAEMDRAIEGARQEAKRQMADAVARTREEEAARAKQQVADEQEAGKARMAQQAEQHAQEPLAPQSVRRRSCAWCAMLYYLAACMLY